MTKRSHHMPTMMPTEISNSQIALRRTAGNHSSCGIAMLSAIFAQ